MSAPKVDVRSFFQDLICFLERRDDLAGFEVKQTEEVSAAVAELIEAAKAIYPYIATQVLEHCNGNKCREPWCAGCCGEEDAEASVEKANEAYWALNSALNRIGGEA